MSNLKFGFCFFLLILCACSSEEEPEVQPSAAVTAYINELIDIMEANSINRKTIDWETVRTEVLERASTVQSIRGADAVLRFALSKLGDNHSFIRRPNGTFISASTLNCRPPNVPFFTTPDHLRYIRVESFSSTDTDETVAFAKSIQELIKGEDGEDVQGWIVDLRNNTGGNMWPMLAGIGPILGEGTVGYFIDPDNVQTQWSYDSGRSILGGSTLVKVPNPYTLINPNPKVAVLLNQAVASSGEAIAVAFIGRENTESFGSATCGLPTANRAYTLSDDSLLLLTVSYMADRNKNKFGESIIPDNLTGDEGAVGAALEYLSE